MRRWRSAVVAALFLMGAVLLYRGSGGSVSERGPSALTRDEAVRDLDSLQAVLEREYAYLRLRDTLWRSAFDSARRVLPIAIPSREFAQGIANLLARFGDGHTRVNGVAPDRHGGDATRRRTRWVAPSPPFQLEMLDEATGYISIPRMSREPLDIQRMELSLEQVGGAQGVILDLRGNGGGGRELVRVVIGRLLAADAPPMVGSVAALRFDLVDGGTLEDAPLADRFMFPAASPRWSAAERDAIAQLAATFQPAWPLGPGEFSPWQYLVLSPTPDARDLSGLRVAVLVDGGCFSACDILASALHQLPNARLFGDTTAGGSGRANTYLLPISRVGLQYSTMASYRPTGELYEMGVAPDTVIAAEPRDGDRVAEAAKAWIRRGMRGET